MLQKKTTRQLRAKRLPRIRKKLFGSAVRPRLTVYKSNTAILAQLVNDETGTVLVSFRGKGKNIAAATALGQELAKGIKAKKITAVVFDRSGYRYHGAIKALADMVREGGIIL